MNERHAAITLIRSLSSAYGISLSDVLPQEAVPFISLPLTNREQQVVRLAAAGKTNAEVGRELGISFETVNKHLDHSYRKTGARNRAALISLYEQNKARNNR